ncbi:MAG: hypothetical protein K9N11_06515 [Lentisphaeria bacterium]|nr:hypothetical protein [Candidatus Neomarinimicrobiota bacterium]MCF7842487.1 hypothetical protein [Lentisphaeria bacterium]
MINRHTGPVFAIFLSVPLFLSAQILLPWENLSSVPDFGVTAGPAVTLNFERPFGYPGVQIRQFGDLTRLNPVNGEPDRLIYPWWSAVSDTTQILLRPPVIHEPDTLGARVMIDYKQGDAAFKNFAFTYKNALSRETAIGWVSENRRHTRFLDVIDYEQQDHRFEYLIQTSNSSIRVQANYNRLRTPFYTIIFDTLTQTSVLDPSDNLNWARYTGVIDAQFIRNTNRWEFLLYQQQGFWHWDDSTRNQWSVLALSRLERRLAKGFMFNAELGYWQQKLGEWNLGVPLAELFVSREGSSFNAALGIKSMGSEILPTGHLRWQRNWFYLGGRLESILQYDLPGGSMHTTSVPQGFLGIRDSIFSAEIMTWQGLGGLPSRWRSVMTSGGRTAGWVLKSQLTLPWQMRLKVGYQELTKGSMDYYTFDQRRVVWGVEQYLFLFNNALLATLRLWGTSHFDVRSARFQSESMQLKTPFLLRADPVHRLSYSVEARISDVIIAFTDRNVLQDPVWQNYLGSDWPATYNVASNLTPEDRFRYLTVVWYFLN